jgi:crotonyl-CoA reductase
MGVKYVINRRDEGYQFWDEHGEQDQSEWRRFGKRIRELAGDDPDIVFEHPGRETLGASVFVCKRGGLVITCAATTGYKLEFDARYLWMNLKTIKGCHFANYREAWESNRLAAEARIHPTLSQVYPLDRVGEAVYEVHHNRHEGKLGILVLSPEEGLGVSDSMTRAMHLDRITLFRRHAPQPAMIEAR